MLRYLQYPGVELVNNYRPGGFLPIHISDTFKDGRYTIAHKLGHGTYSTVWLVKDSLTGKYASLKVLAANAAEWSGNDSSSSASGDNEIAVLSRLHSDADEDEGKEHVMRLLDHFDHHGDNGIHRCIVSELLGPDLSSDIEDLYSNEIFPPNVVKRFIRQICYGVRYLHSKGIVHGDLHIGNLLLDLPALKSLSTQAEVESYLGEPRKRPLRTIDSKSISNSDTSPPESTTHVPMYVVTKPDTTSLLHLCLDDPAQAHIKICDFSESFIFHPTALDKGRKVNLPLVYRAPEVFFNHIQAKPTPSMDIWALAVLFHFLFTGGAGLFHSPSGVEDELLREMVLTSEKLPEPIWSSWTNRVLYFDDDGNWIGNKNSRPHWLGKFLRNFEDKMDDAERDDFEKMLKSMVNFDASKRATIDEVIASDWFVHYCRDAV